MSRSLEAARRLRRVLASDPGFAALTISAWVLLVVARGVITIASMARIGRFLGRALHETPVDPLADQARRRSLRVARAIRKAVPFTPTNSNCYPQALTAHWLLRLWRIPQTIYYGAAFSAVETGLNTHVWVRCGDVVVTGAPQHRAFGVVAAYAWAPASSGVVVEPLVIDRTASD